MGAYVFDRNTTEVINLFSELSLDYLMVVSADPALYAAWLGDNRECSGVLLPLKFVFKIQPCCPNQ